MWGGRGGHRSLGLGFSSDRSGTLCEGRGEGPGWPSPGQRLTSVALRTEAGPLSAATHPRIATQAPHTPRPLGFGRGGAKERLREADGALSSDSSQCPRFSLPSPSFPRPLRRGQGVVGGVGGGQQPAGKRV